MNYLKCCTVDLFPISWWWIQFKMDRRWRKIPFI